MRFGVGRIALKARTTLLAIEIHGDGDRIDSLRRQVEDRGAMPNIPPKANRK